jgi:hypothetical protein
VGPVPVTQQNAALVEAAAAAAERMSGEAHLLRESVMVFKLADSDAAVVEDERDFAVA